MQKNAMWFKSCTSILIISLQKHTYNYMYSNFALKAKLYAGLTVSNYKLGWMVLRGLFIYRCLNSRVELKKTYLICKNYI